LHTFCFTKISAFFADRNRERKKSDSGPDSEPGHANLHNQKLFAQDGFCLRVIGVSVGLCTFVREVPVHIPARIRHILTGFHAFLQLFPLNAVMVP
jgi:hypothetical protein